MWFLLLFLIIINGNNGIKHNIKPVLSMNRPIVGGSEASITTFPYQISMQADKMVFLDLNEETFDYQHFCGGSIISIEWILTAAHCVERSGMTNYKLKYFRIRVGSSSIIEGGHLHEISKYIVHPDYNDLKSSNNYDISIIKVKTPFEFSPSVQPITLNKNPIVTGGIATVSGWGRTSMSGDKPEKLQKVSFPILPLWECQLMYISKNITDNVFCAGRAMRSACHGDSGGPVVYNGVQIGVVSGGANCQRPDYAGIYANVYRLRDWIHENSGV